MTAQREPVVREAELPGPGWHVSGYSASGNDCVEHGRLADGRRAVRDTKNRQGGTLIFSTEAWTCFVDAVKAGAFDL